MSNESKKYEFGGITIYSLEEIENVILNDAEYLDVFAGSDLRFKENIEPVKNSLLNLLQLDPIKYNYKEEFQQKNGFSHTAQLGLLAQNLAEVYPELLAKDSSGYLSVNYQGLVPVLIDAVKDLNKKVSDLEETVKTLKNN